jgi:hypothetical protein
MSRSQEVRDLLYGVREKELTCVKQRHSMQSTHDWSVLAVVA